MLNIQARCNGVFIGHAIASQFDSSVQMSQQLSESLLELKRFDGPDIMSRYLYLYHTKRYDLGETTKIVYQNFKDQIKTDRGHSPVCREDFLFDQLFIDETVKLADNKLGGYTAGCGPAHRSFSLALCPWIDDDDLFDLAKAEAKLTHYSPLAGQVSGIINLICRSLLRDKTWQDAVQSAFLTPALHVDVSAVYLEYNRWCTPSKETHPAYAPTVLNAALHYITSSSSAVEAIEKANIGKNFYCLPIIGVLSGALWGIPIEMYKNKVDNAHFKVIHDIANKFSNQWTSQPDSLHA
jgi:ADP-ribosylglycohydrolase